MGFYEGFKPDESVEKNVSRWFEDFSERWQVLADAMRGPKSPQGLGYGDGMSILVFVSQGELKCRLQLRAKRLVAFLTITNGKSVFDAVEAHLRSGDLDWRKDKS